MNCFLETEDGWNMDELRHARLSLDEELALAECCQDCAYLLLNNIYGLSSATLHLLNNRHSDETIKELIAQHPATSAVTLRGLAYEDDGDIRLFVAQHPHTQAPVLEELAVWGLGGREDQEPILQAIMENPNCPDELAGQCLFRLSMQ